ncbi:hypothetical protein SKAU_G00112750 [Synaphobranchus kaupii]|uniref:Uncharacterized protein n=1 Tax=Synaphobranchus kaupii TaxID=118154 RepID=A0A9Q1G113_SYNKA|nr:hypothetical protein SKAU_G00112750 [Synaphobranchus kaupii]
MEREGLWESLGALYSWNPINHRLGSHASHRQPITEHRGGRDSKLVSWRNTGEEVKDKMLSTPLQLRPQ